MTNVLDSLKLVTLVKLVMGAGKIALSSEDIPDPSTVFKCTAEHSILILYCFSIMLYTLVLTSERADPESIRALNPLPACTVTAGLSDTSTMV